MRRGAPQQRRLGGQRRLERAARERELGELGGHAQRVARRHRAAGGRGRRPPPQRVAVEREGVGGVGGARRQVQHQVGRVGQAAAGAGVSAGSTLYLPVVGECCVLVYVPARVELGRRLRLAAGLLAQNALITFSEE